MELYPQQIFALLILSGGLVALAHVAWTARKVQEAQQWPSVKGHVTASEIRRGNGKNAGYRARIRYTYVVDEREHVGRRFALGGELNASSPDPVEERCTRYPEGSEPEVYYDPENPSDACLAPIVEGTAATILVGGLFTALGVAMLLGFLTVS